MSRQGVIAPPTLSDWVSAQCSIRDHRQRHCRVRRPVIGENAVHGVAQLLNFRGARCCGSGAWARSHGIVSVIDNTWANAFYYNPFEHGVDITIEAATKYITVMRMRCWV